MSFKLDPAIWSRETGQRIPCFDRCQLTITCMSSIKDIRCKPRLHDLVCARVWPPCCATSFLVGHTLPRSMPLAMLAIKKESHGLSISMHVCGSVPIIMVLRLTTFRAAEAPLLRTLLNLSEINRRANLLITEQRKTDVGSRSIKSVGKSG